jgi:hypothetical protein
MRPPFTYLAVLGLAAIAVPAGAQSTDSTIAERRRSAQVLDHTFTGPVGEPIRVFLAKDMNYRVETQGRGITLLLRPMEMSMPTPLLSKFTAGSSASNGEMYTVTPKADGVYQFISNGGDPTQPIRLRVYAAPVKSKSAKP